MSEIGNRSREREEKRRDARVTDYGVTSFSIRPRLLDAISASLSLSPSAKAIAQRNALRKSALRGDTRHELAGGDLDTVIPNAFAPYVRGALIYFAYAIIFIQLVQCRGASCLERRQYVPEDLPLRSSSTFDVASLRFSLVEVPAQNAGKRGPRFRTENCDATRHDAMSSTSRLDARALPQN